MLWVLGVGLPVFLLFLLFYLKMLGAGDIKLLSVLGGAYGWKASIYILLLALCFGGVWSIIKIIYNHNLRERFLYFWTYINNILILKERVPYLVKGSYEHSYTIHFSIMILLAFIFYHLI